MKNKSNKKYTTGYEYGNISLIHQLKKGEDKNPCIHPYEKLGGLSKMLYIKGYEFNWYSKLSVSFNVNKYKDVIQYHHGQTMHHLNIYTRAIGNRRIREVSHIRSIAPYINAII